MPLTIAHIAQEGIDPSTPTRRDTSLDASLGQALTEGDAVIALFHDDYGGGNLCEPGPCVEDVRFVARTKEELGSWLSSIDHDMELGI